MIAISIAIRDPASARIDSCRQTAIATVLISGFPIASGYLQNSSIKTRFDRKYFLFLPVDRYSYRSIRPVFEICPLHIAIVALQDTRRHQSVLVVPKRCIAPIIFAADARKVISLCGVSKSPLVIVISFNFPCAVSCRQQISVIVIGIFDASSIGKLGERQSSIIVMELEGAPQAVCYLVQQSAGIEECNACAYISWRHNCIQFSSFIEFLFGAIRIQ
ncbi:hypothetical protein KWM_0113455 [Xanthomonas vasicola pv. musacearum NCPPB 2005]|nr:hypothetical protein KWM_0113455 [Xanthomonas vasicola pv. musacearum NCPPB 2005]KFA13760.1 hypothetical protein KWQ_0105805 [Xanthomonas vasicola pv. musacearum NCPPB 4380]KFA17242.1 hypothetical protein A11G_0115255 [Xanthomonas vasicola pv. musacearum NCPPB 4392]KFA23962.1 hypothetical protein KWU_0106375 [Xanthomonas vasicola pv. musacearum NCPPB 4394]KFA39729.1 hypothetical protein KWS_0101445 [Xanthomonas vasicola pv. musacearum NCPPB 4384]